MSDKQHKKSDTLGGMTPAQFEEYKNLPARDRDYFLRKHNLTLNPKRK